MVEPSAPPADSATPPPFTAFAHQLSTAVSDLTALVNALYTLATQSTDAHTRQHAQQLIETHTQTEQIIRSRERAITQCEWELLNDSNEVIGSLNIATITGGYVTGMVGFGLEHRFTIDGRSKAHAHSSIDSNDNLHITLELQKQQSRIEPSMPTMPGPFGAPPPSSNKTATLALTVHSSNERIRGEVQSGAKVSHFSAEAEELDHVEFRGRRKAPVQ